MKIMVVGHGGREHAIALALAHSSYHPELIAFMSYKNPGVEKLCSKVIFGEMRNVDNIVSSAWDNKVDMVMVGPEEPLIFGVIDHIIKKGIPCIGPQQNLAKLEGDKSYLREIISRSVPDANPVYKICNNTDDIKAFLKSFINVAVKPLGLTGGKGVKVTGAHLHNQSAVIAYANEIINKENKVLLEEKLDGEEFSLMAFSDGSHLIPMPLAQDAKYAYEEDKGPMTGGMGAYTQADHLLPFINRNTYEKSFEILQKVINEVQEENEEYYHGIVYGQFMLTAKGPKLIEVNVRFGDPEAINVLSLIRNDLVDVLMKVALSLLSQVEFAHLASVCKYLVPIGYPETNPKPMQIKIDEKIFKEESTQLIYAGAESVNGFIQTTGARFAAVLANRVTIEAAERAVEHTIERMQLKGFRHRKDIATIELINKRINHLQMVMR